MVTSAYSSFLSNPELIPRMSGETVEDALARVQGWHDAAVSRYETRNNILGSAGLTTREEPAPIPIDNYVPGSGNLSESAWRLIGGTPRTEVLPENYDRIYNPNDPSTPYSYDPATGVASPGTGPGSKNDLLNPGSGQGTGTGTGAPVVGGNPNFGMAKNQLKARTPAVGGGMPASRGYNMSRQTVGAAGNDMLGVGNADYQSELIKGLRGSSNERRSSNPGVSMISMVPTGGSGGAGMPGGGSSGGVFNPGISQPDLASPQDVENYAKYSAYKVGQVGSSQPYLSYNEWLAQQTAAPATPGTNPGAPSPPPPPWMGDHQGL